MNRRRGGLGSGLDALLPTGETGGVREAPTASIHPNTRQPRTHFDDASLDELAASIREHGIIQPLIVSERAAGGYELIAGERRWRAAQRAGLERVPVIVREAAPQQLLELALIENVQRADLSALEEARAYQALVDDFGMTDGQIAQRLGKNSREAIANTRRLLNLVPQAQEAVLRRRISAGHGRALLKLKDPQQQRQALDIIIGQELSVREAERLGDLIPELGSAERALSAIRSSAAAARPGRRRAARAPEPPADTADDREAARALERILGTPVSISRSEKEVRVTIAFHTEEKLQEFFDWLSAR